MKVVNLIHISEGRFLTIGSLNRQYVSDSMGDARIRARGYSFSTSCWDDRLKRIWCAPYNVVSHELFADVDGEDTMIETIALLFFRTQRVLARA